MAEADAFALTGTSSTGVPIFQPVSATNPMPVTAVGTVVIADKTIVWIAPTTATITASGTVVAAGPNVSIISNASTSGGTLTLNLFGGTAVANVGVPLAPGQNIAIMGQPTATAITGICSSGTCIVGIQSGSQ